MEKVKMKRILAREVIIFTLGLLLLGGTIGSIWINNRIKHKNKIEFFIAVSKLKQQRDQLKLDLSVEGQPKWVQELKKPEFDPTKPYEKVPSIEELERESARDSIYNKISEKYDVGSLSEFLKKITIPAKRQILYNQLVSDGYNLGTFEQFERDLGFVPVESLIDTIDLDKVKTTSDWADEYRDKPLPLNELKKGNRRAELAYLNKWIKDYDETIAGIYVMSRNELIHLYKQVAFFILIGLYPIRLLIIAILWALKTLRSK